MALGGRDGSPGFPEQLDVISLSAVSAGGEWRTKAPLVRSTGYFVIELKTGKFPEYAGKLNFYIASSTTAPR